MRSPFPSMDPYLERRWKPIHTMLIAEAVRAIQPQLPADLVALPEEDDDQIERHIEIRQVDGDAVVTAIEILSPRNKVGNGLAQYLKKRKQYLSSGTNLVEIDLVRAGNWLNMVHPYGVPAEHRTVYRVSVKRAHGQEEMELYPITLQDKLPVVRIPLREGETAITLDLQELLDLVYVTLKCDRIDYRKPCDPPLGAEEAAWTAEVIRAAGK